MVKADYILVKGSSFVCAEVTAKIANSKHKNKIKILEEICDGELELNVPFKKIMDYKIKYAAVFPFNKEVHALARYEMLLDFVISDFYHLRISGKIGKKICDILPNCYNQAVLKDIDEINWNSFDTLILGHTDELSNITRMDYKKILTQKAIEKNKNLYCFDAYNLETCGQVDNNSKLYYPMITEKNIHVRFGKLYKTNKPILL